MRQSREQRNAYIREYIKRPEIKAKRLGLLRKRYRRGDIQAKYRHRCKLYDMTPKGKYLQYRKSAKDRGIPFELTLEQFIPFWQQPCRYCGAPIPTIGLDRVDNTKGYVTGNIGACCITCNKAKLQRTAADYVAHCLAVVRYCGDEFGNR